MLGHHPGKVNTVGVDGHRVLLLKSVLLGLLVDRVQASRFGVRETAGRVPDATVADDFGVWHDERAEHFSQEEKLERSAGSSSA
jgi:hypothetical protein